MSTIETDELKPWWVKLKEALEQKNEDNYCKVDATDLEFSIEDYQRIHQQLQSLHTSLVAAVEGKKATSYDERNMSTDETAAYNQAIYDTLTIINSIFKE